jgi:hypothetical protein
MASGKVVDVVVWKGAGAPQISECYVFSDVDWITQDNGSLIIWDRGYEERTVSLRIEENAGPARSGIVTIDPAGTDEDELTIYLTVEQDGEFD